MNRKYFYKIALYLGDKDCKTILSYYDAQLVKTANWPDIEEQIEEFNGKTSLYDGLTDLDGNPHSRRKNTERTDVKNISSEQGVLFPAETIDGEVITEKGFRSWVKKEIRDYIDALIENMEWKEGSIDPNRVMEYASKKGWIDFVNKFNPIKFFLGDGQRYHEYASKFKEQSGKSLKKEYQNAVRRMVKKRNVEPVV